MPIIPSIVSWLNIKRINQIELFRKYPVNVQREVFFKLIAKGIDTAWGKMYDYQSIKTIEDFKARVPLQDYNSLKSYIDRIRQGERDVLWKGETRWFAKSSGTTSDKSKFIPVTKDSIEDTHFRGGRDVLAFYTAINPNTEIFKGKGLVIGGSQQVENYNNDIYYGDLSAVLIENLPFWVHLIRTPERSIALMNEWEEKIERMAQTTIKENVTNISGVPSWTMVLIKRILEITGADNLIDVWPGLEVFFHGGVSFEPYRQHYRKLIHSDKVNYMETYNASEGFFGIQDDPNTLDMLLMLDYGIFYEFLPVENLGDENPRTLQLDEVEVGKSYALIMSASNGLWRYNIGDTVEFTSRFPFKIRITGRTRHFINAFGEEVIVENADKAIKTATDRTGSIVKEYTAAPVFMGTDTRGCHQWLIEFETYPDDIQYFAEILDSTLKSLNSDYEAKRYKNMTLEFPQVIVARPGLFYDWLKEKGKLGGQHKVPRLANNRQYIDELIALNSRQ